MPDFHGRVGKQGNLICMPVLDKKFLKNGFTKNKGFVLCLVEGRIWLKWLLVVTSVMRNAFSHFVFVSTNAFISFFGDVNGLSSVELAAISIEHTSQEEVIARDKGI